MLNYTITFSYDGLPASSSAAYSGDTHQLLDNEYVCDKWVHDNYTKVILRDGRFKVISDKPGLLYYFDKVKETWCITDEHLAIVMIDARKIAIGKVSTTHASMLNTLTGNASEAERNTWPIKILQSTLSISADKPTEGAILLFEREAIADGVTVMEKCNRVIVKNNAATKLIGIAGGIKTETENLINNAKTPDEINKILSDASIKANEAAIEYLDMINSSK